MVKSYEKAFILPAENCGMCVTDVAMK